MGEAESRDRAAPIIPISRGPRPKPGQRRPADRTARPVSVQCSCCGRVREVIEPAPILLTFSDGTSLVYLACDGCEQIIDQVAAEVGLSVVVLSIVRDEMQELTKPDPSVVGRIVRRVQWRQNPGRAVLAAMTEALS